MPRDNAKEKREARQRAAETGENYATALRKIREQRAAAERDAGEDPHD